jgi:hypothetical protein
LVETRRSLSSLATVNQASQSVANAWKLLSFQPSSVEGYSVSDFRPETDYFQVKEGQILADHQRVCEANLNDGKRRAVLMFQDAEAATFALAQTWKEAVGLDGSFESVAIERFRTTLNNTLGPEIATDRIFATPSAFEQTFITAADGPRLLISKLQARANAQRPPLSCATLAR